MFKNSLPFLEILRKIKCHPTLPIFRFLPKAQIFKNIRNSMSESSMRGGLWYLLLRCIKLCRHASRRAIDLEPIAPKWLRAKKGQAPATCRGGLGEPLYNIFETLEATLIIRNCKDEPVNSDPAAP